MLCPSTPAPHQPQRRHPCAPRASRWGWEPAQSGTAPSKKAVMGSGDAGRGGREEGRVI